MKNLKNILVASFLTIGAFATTMMVSCNPDPCKDVVCANGGTCDAVTGDCSCAAGYEGASCDSLSRAKFIASYNVTASCQASYVASIATSATGDGKVIVTNIANLNTVGSGTTTVTGNCDKSSITIPRQFVTGLATTEVEGNGTINGSTLTLTYTVWTGGTVAATCTNTNWVKQ